MSSDASPTDHDAQDDRQHEDEGGAVSEVANLGGGEAIQPDQSVAGSPDAEDDDVQEGKQGPNARTGNDAPGN